MQDQVRSLKASVGQHVANSKRRTSSSLNPVTPAPRRLRGMLSTAEKGSRSYNRSVERMADKLLPHMQQLNLSSRSEDSTMAAESLVACIRRLPGGDRILEQMGRESGTTHATFQRAKASIEEACQKIADVVSSRHLHTNKQSEHIYPVRPP